MASTSESWQPIEIEAGSAVYSVTFTADGEHLISGGDSGVRIWRVRDGRQVATMPVERRGVCCVAASKDGQYIAAGSAKGEVLVWDAKTREQVLRHSVGAGEFAIQAVDFSPDAPRLVSADGNNNTATVWNIPARRLKAQTLDHDKPFYAAKYSPQGDRIAVATDRSIRIWDNRNRLLADFSVEANPRAVHWLNDHLLVETKDRIIKQIDAATGSTVLEWSVPHTDGASGIAMPQDGKFIAYSAKKTISLWDTLTYTQLSVIPHSLDIRSVVCSSDGQLLASLAESRGVIKVMSSVKLGSISEPKINIDSAALNAWKRGQLADAEALLTKAIPTSQKTAHHLLASRALVWARLGQWDEALVDAEKSIEAQRSVLGYIAKSVALVGKGESHKACQVCDIASLHFHADRVTLLLIKAVLLFMAGEHEDAISRVENLINDVSSDPALFAIQAYMHYELGSLHAETDNYEGAIRSFEDAQVKLGDRTHLPPLMVLLISGWKFDDLGLTIHQRLCEVLRSAGRVKEAGESLLRMLDKVTVISEPTRIWVSGFKSQCRGDLENLGDHAASARQYDEAISFYAVALSLDPSKPEDLLIKRSKACAEQGRWEDALNDADKVVKLDPSSPLGYERQYAALLGIGRHGDAICAFETMLSRMSESSDPEICEQSRHYVRPERTKEAIRASVKNVIRDSPLVLINTSSGRLCSQSEQIAAFESTPAFTSLVLSMATHIDYDRIEQVVGEFFRYVTLSHTWQADEPLYDQIVRIVVYGLAASPTHDKLRMFCEIVREEGFNWAWSDTCCINKTDPFVLQESLVSMFKWYEGSAMTLIFLFDVDGLAGPGALVLSIWNSRGWTLQEYHASKVVRIYTKDWKPYLGLTIYNHKEAPEVISEMEKATGISARALIAIRPGLNDIREKLRLASTRRTTRVEDAAYSLLGIFSMSLAVTYGENDKSLGRLLSQLLTSSGDASILAWTGKSNSFNSCLPAHIAAFKQPLTSHIPPAIADTDMETITAGLRASSLDLALVTKLYDQVNKLPVPSFSGQRMKLPCLCFEIRSVSPRRKGSEVVFYAQAGALNTVEIKTGLDLRKLGSLYLVYPWIDFLLDRHATGSRVESAPEGHEPTESDDFISLDSLTELSGDSDEDPLDSVLSPTSLPMDGEMHIYEFLARLRQPFGAFLLVPRRRNAEYKRIVTESLITAQVEEITPATLGMVYVCWTYFDTFARPLL